MNLASDSFIPSSPTILSKSSPPRAGSEEGQDIQGKTSDTGEKKVYVSLFHCPISDGDNIGASGALYALLERICNVLLDGREEVDFLNDTTREKVSKAIIERHDGYL